jgi:hypothetical protein
MVIPVKYARILFEGGSQPVNFVMALKSLTNEKHLKTPEFSSFIVVDFVSVGTSGSA